MQQEWTTQTESSGGNRTILLRAVSPEDLPIFFDQQLDDAANRMAAFTAKDPADRDAFLAHWTRNLENDANINRTILYQGKVIGHIASFEQCGNREVTYWLDKAYWGQGLATQALARFLEDFPARPLFARVVKDNVASLRVLAKCGFVIVGEDTGFAHARNAEVEEFILELRPHPFSAESER